jgi:hypothetical protein
VVSTGAQISRFHIESHTFNQIEMPATEKDNVSFTDFANKVIHIVLADLYSTIRIASQIGESMMCTDNVCRALHIGVLIASLDFPEALVWRIITLIV